VQGTLVNGTTTEYWTPRTSGNFLSGPVLITLGCCWSHWEDHVPRISRRSIHFSSRSLPLIERC